MSGSQSLKEKYYELVEINQSIWSMTLDVEGMKKPMLISDDVIDDVESFKYLVSFV